MGLFDSFRKSVIDSVGSGPGEGDGKGRDAALIFGALMAKVAAADGVVTPDEKQVMGEILKSELGLGEADVEVAVAAAQAAAKKKTDLRALCQEYNDVSDYETRKKLVDCLYRVAAADEDVAREEQDRIRLIANYLWLSVVDYGEIRAKYV